MKGQVFWATLGASGLQARAEVAGVDGEGGRGLNARKRSLRFVVKAAGNHGKL